MRFDDSEGRFDPAIVHLVDGGTVRWSADGGTHELVTYHPATHGEHRRIPREATPWTSGQLGEDEPAFEWSFDVEGGYDLCCRLHEADGMVASVVGWPDPDEQPALDSPIDGYPSGAGAVLAEHVKRIRPVLDEVHGDG